MIEYVFRHSRMVGGKKVLSRVFCGRYAIERGAKPVTVRLNTPDREIARKRLRAIVLEKQREQEGIIAPKAVRVAATTPLGDLIADYEADLLGRGLDDRHVHDTIARLKRMVADTGWRALSDIRPDAFVSWRATLTCSAKTVKEYQTSAAAFLNWLVRVDRLAANPLAKIDKIDARGKQVREPLAFTEDELRRLFGVAGRRLPAYLVLLYTGQRKDEVRSLVWGDLHLDEVQPYVLVRESTTKDKDKRAVPLHRDLAALLREMRPAHATPTTSVFFGRFPTYESLRADLERAGIPHTDELGRVVHFHAFRKTWQTLGVRYGINQRAAQEVLGHSDPSLTARAYTDVAALALHSEIAKLPWISGSKKSTQIGTQKSGKPGHLASLRVIEGTSEQTSQVTVDGVLSPFLTLSGTSGQRREMVVGTGFEPVVRFLQACVAFVASVSTETDDTQLRTQKPGELREMIKAWSRLSPELHAAALGVTRAVTK
jgi:integrase